MGDSPPVTVSALMSVWRPDVNHLRAAIASVLAQTFADFELIVVEDPSEVAVAPLLAEFADARVHHVVTPGRVPVSTSRNQALALARGEFVAITDADDLYLPQRFAEQVAFLRSHPDTTACGGQVELIDAEGRHLGFREYPREPAAIAAALRRYNAIAHPTAMVRRAAMVASGGYDVEVSGCEDYDLWSRLARAGHRLANLPDVLTRYRLHPGSTKATRLRATIDHTLRIKRRHWGDEMNTADRLRMLGERVLRWLPGGLVSWLFVRRYVQSSPTRDPRG